MKWVLVIESSKFHQQYLERIIGRMGYKVLVAETGEKGIHFMKGSLPDAVICGDHLPDISPLHLPGVLKGDPQLSTVSLLYLTADRDEALRRKVLEAGFSNIVLRPISIRNFFEKLENCFSGYRRQHLRAFMRFPVRVYFQDVLHRLETVTFGEGGMYLNNANPFAVDKPLRLDFELPKTSRTISVGSKVLYSLLKPTETLPAGNGLSFLNLTDAVRTTFGICVENYLVRAVA